jgi:hypothetical protein
MTTNRFLSVPIEDLSKTALIELKATIDFALGEDTETTLPTPVVESELSDQLYQRLNNQEKLSLRGDSIEYSLTETVDVEFYFTYRDGYDECDTDYCSEPSLALLKRSEQKYNQVNREMNELALQYFKKYKNNLEEYFKTTITQKEFKKLFKVEYYR